MATGYNLNHLQIAPKIASPTYTDVNYATTAEFGISQDKEYFSADGKRAVTAFSAPEGEGSIGFGTASTSMLAIMTGGTASTSGIAPNVINRLEIKGNSTPPAIILAAWIPNVDGNQANAGMRITVPNGSLTVPSTSFEQETWTEFTADLSFVADANNNMLIWEVLQTAPTFNAGVMPVNLTAPA